MEKKRIGKKRILLTIALIAIAIPLVAAQSPSPTSSPTPLPSPSLQCTFFSDLLNEKDVVILTDKINHAAAKLCSEDQPLFERELVNLFKTRKLLLIQEIKKNPDHALLTPSLSESVIVKLTEEQKKDFLEERGTFTGTTKTLHIDYQPPRESEFKIFIITEQKEYELFSSEPLPAFRSNVLIQVEGMAIENFLVLDLKKFPIKLPNIYPITSLSNQELEKSISTLEETGKQRYFSMLQDEKTNDENLGDQNFLVLLINLKYDAPASKESAQNLLFSDAEGSLKDFYKKNSYGKTSLRGDIFGPYSLSEEFCDNGGIEQAALTAAQNDLAAQGKKFADYQHLVLILYPHCEFTIGGALGVGSIGKYKVKLPDGAFTLMSMAQIYSPSLLVTAHEIGHNFGVHHANSYSCQKGAGESDFSFECTSQEYGDPFSVMGNRKPGYHTAAHKQEMGWLSSDNIITATEGTYTLKPQEVSQPAGSIQMIKIPVGIDTSFYGGDENLYYTLEVRQPVDYDAGFYKQSAYEGVETRLAELKDDKTFVSKQTSLLPIPIGQYEKYWLLKGESFTDLINGYRITLNDFSGKGADASAKVTITKIPGVEIDFQNPLVYYDFNEESRYSFEDRAGHVGGGIY